MTKLPTRGSLLRKIERLERPELSRAEGVGLNELLEDNMPIRPENRKRYQKDWKAISAAIRERAGNRCEGSPDFPECRAENGQAHPETGSRVVLTVAHLDHTPENCEPENLKAMCQRCHLNYDKEHHARTAYRTRMDKAGVEDMFGFPSNAALTGERSESELKA